MCETLILFETTLQLISNIGCLLLLDHSEIPFIAFIIIVPTINANTIKNIIENISNPVSYPYKSINILPVSYYINNINNNIPPTPQDGDVASGKTWRDDFDIYLSEVTEAFEKISSDKEFIKNRQKYHPELDIVLSLKKAFEDYWSQEAGWKRKKISKTKHIDWVSTFKKALDQPQNKVYKQRNVNPEPEQLTPLQERFRKFLEDNGPLLLKMPSQPTDQEVESLAKMNKSMLTDIVRKINNDSYITRYKNSVYQTIMEIKKKEYG